MEVITPALSAVLGLVVGAFLQYYFSRRLEAARHFQEHRTRAYSDFIGATADSANASRMGDKKLQAEALAKATEAKVRILLYGSAGVVNALAEFSTAQGSLDSEPIAHRFVALVQAMRADSAIQRGDIPDSAIASSVFAPRNELLP